MIWKITSGAHANNQRLYKAMACLFHYSSFYASLNSDFSSSLELALKEQAMRELKGMVQKYVH